MARPRGSSAEVTGPRIREAALRLIARHGYAAISMRQIAADVGLQAGALYNYTPDKQALLFDLMQDHMSELLAARQAVARPGPPAARLADFVAFHIRFHLPRPDQVFVAYMELRSLAPENRATITGQRRAYEDALEAILRDGVASGDFRVADTRIATLALIGLLAGLSDWYRDGGRLPLARIEALYTDMALRAVTA